MMGGPDADLQTIAEAVRRVIDELNGILWSMEALAREDRQPRGLPARRADGESDDSLRRERDELAETVRELRSRYQALADQPEARKPGPRKVMVVDDAPSELRLMESILRSAGHEVLAYGDGEGLEDRVAAERPDVLLLDILLPKRNGYEILRALKKDERTRRTPVVVVTARDQESDRVWSRLHGAAEYVMKPFTPEQLLAAVETLARPTTR
jgi:CheY-like chemotaxis protein